MVVTNAITALLSLSLLAGVQAAHPGKPAASPQGAQKPADPLAEAEALLQQQQFAAAEEKLLKAVFAQANNAQAWFDLAYAESHLGKTREAITAYRKATELAPNWFEANLNLGVTLGRSGDLAAAAAVLRHAVELKPSSGGDQALSKAWDSLAHVLEESDPRSAAEAYSKAATLNPGNLDQLVDAGRMLEKANELAGAEKSFRQAADAGNTRGVAMLINLLSRQKKYEEAEGWLHKYVERNPQDGEARALLGKLLAAEGKTAEGIAVMEAARAASGSAESDNDLAELYLQTRQYQKAEPIFRQLLQKRPSDAELHGGLGISLLYQLKYPEAESELIQAVKLKPDYANAYGYLADAARENKHFELAIHALDARAKFQPDDAKTYFIRATSYDSLHMLKPAAENYKKFLTAAGGKFPDQEFQARHRLKAIQSQ